MPKVYYYADEEVGVKWPGPDADFILPNGQRKYDVPWPRFVWYGLPGFEETKDPGKADVFIMRQRLIWVSEGQIRSLPYLKGNQRRHVFFDLGSDSNPKCYRDFPDIPAIFLRAVCSKSMLAQNPTTVAWPWPVDDLQDYVKLPAGGFKYDVVFQGQRRERALLESVQRANLDVHLRQVSGFYGTMPYGAPKAKLRREFLETMASARLSLCYRTFSGIVRYRFYEAMSMGRVPVLFCDDCVLPHSDRIDYGRCSLQLREHDASKAGNLLANWLKQHSDEEIAEMGQYGRAMWERWLKRENWDKVTEVIVKERLGF